MITNVAAFKDSAGKIHTSRLQALLAEKRIETRAVLVQAFEKKGIKLNGVVSSEDVVAICAEFAPELAKVSSRFTKMIRNEQAKGAAA